MQDCFVNNAFCYCSRETVLNHAGDTKPAQVSSPFDSVDEK